MTTFPHFIWVVLKGSVAAMLAAFVLTGCASIDLAPDINAPQVRMPESAPPVQQPPPVRTMPIAPESAITQPLPLSDSTDSGLEASPADTPAANASAAAPAANEHLVTLTSNPDGASELPPTPSNATAQIDLLYDTSTRLLRWKAEWTGLSSPITAIRFYGSAAQGQQGQPTLIWPGPFGPRYEGRATLTPQQAAQLMGGLWYVNISTMNYLDGEIRGQLQVVY